MSQRLFKTVLCATLFLGWIFSTNAGAQTLIDLFEVGRDAFVAQNYAEAAESFRQLENAFSAEPEFSEPTFQKYYLSMHGMSALLSGDPDSAVKQLQKYMATHYERERSDALILLGLIQGTRQLEDSAELDSLYEKFLRDFPAHPDYHLIRFERMLSLFELGKLEKGLAEVDQLSTARTPKDLRFRAKLAGLQQLLNQEVMEQAGELLLETQWEVTHMPEMAVLAISSLKVGNYYMDRKNWAAAIRAFRLVPFYQVLVDTQRSRLRVLQSTLDSARKRGASQLSRLWENHYVNLIAQVKSRLEQLEKGEDYTATFLLKYGRCFLFNSQFAEAWVVFRSLALTEGIESVIEEQAWYHWILASHGAENWDEARELCIGFAAQFPDSDLLPKTFYLLARTHQESGDFPRANQVLTDLIKRFPGHADKVEWYITRGFNLASLNENELALADFNTAIDQPGIQQSFLVKARYWKGVTLSALREYDAAFDVFENLLSDFPDHWMYPEFQYRQAMVYYSQRDYSAAETMLNTFLSSNPDHFYVPEAKVLLGDVAMGMGELDRAVELFSAIPTTDPRLFMYAFFQIGKIYRAREQYQAMEQHFQHYLQAVEFDGKARISEALYWLGWSLNQMDRQIETIPLYLSAISKYGNDPMAGELISMIQALEVLKKKQLASEQGLDAAGAGATEVSVREFLNARTFESWLVDVIQVAKELEQLTFYARLQLYEAIKIRQSGSLQDELARSAIQGISLKTPLEAMDDQLLGEIGLSLAEDGFEAANEYLKRVLLVYPQSPSKALAYYGFAILATHKGSWDEALKWLGLLEKETPNHSRLFDAQLLKAEVLTALNRYEASAACYNDLLRLKQARGEPHVKALLGLAKMHEQKRELEQSIPYYQRIYTLYRAYRPYVAKAYLESARLFEAIGNEAAAYRTLVEFTDQQDLMEYSEYVAAGAELVRLESELGEDRTAGVENESSVVELPEDREAPSSAPKGGQL